MSKAEKSGSIDLTLDAILNPAGFADQIDEFAQLGRPRVSLSLKEVDQLDFPTLQSLLAAREYCIQRGLVMRLTDVSEDVQARIRWADAGRLLEDDLLLV